MSASPLHSFACLAWSSDLEQQTPPGPRGCVRFCCGATVAGARAISTPARFTRRRQQSWADGQTLELRLGNRDSALGIISALLTRGSCATPLIPWGKAARRVVMPALQASAGSVSVNRCSIHACLGEQALARAGDRPTAMYTQPPLAQPPAASSTSILRDSVRGDEPNPRPTATETHRDMAMADSSASMVSGSRRADVDVPGDRGVGAPASSVSQPTVISASSGASTDALQTSSSDLSHLTSTDMADADLTPLTSTSTLSTAFSSQESSTVSEPHVPAEPAMRTTGTDAQIAVSVPLASDVRSNGSLSTSVPDSLSNATTPRVELVQGQKRTAAGEVKPSSYGAAPQSPGSNGFAARGRSRTMSIGSNGSRIAEVR